MHICICICMCIYLYNIYIYICTYSCIIAHDFSMSRIPFLGLGARRAKRFRPPTALVGVNAYNDTGRECVHPYPSDVS